MILKIFYWLYARSSFQLLLIIEVIQGIFGMGLAETDDVIMNLLGTALGSLAYFLSKTGNHRPLLSSRKES